MNVVFIVPTGIGAEIGGHAGDATPAAKLVASLCDKLFVHPNIVNASDVNEMTENMLYVEGSMLDGFLEGRFGLEEVHSNRILLAVNRPVRVETINAVSGARATIGADIEIVELATPVKMSASVIDGKASGDIRNLDEALSQVRRYDFDVLIVNTPIETDDGDVIAYLTRDGGTNIWGGIEAKLSKIMSDELKRPVIHAPIENSEAFKSFNEVVDPRKAAEMVSMCYLHCCIKGAHRAPKLSSARCLGRGPAYWNNNIDFLVTPANVVGRPHRACLKNGISIIAVAENRTALNDTMPDSFMIAKNYLEVAGIIGARKAGITISSLGRPLARTKITMARREDASSDKP